MAKTKQQSSSGEDNKGSTIDHGDLTEGRDWVYSATNGAVSDINWINHWKQMRARWHPDYLFGARHGARVYRYWDEDYMNSDYIVAVDADVEVPYHPYSYPMYNQSSSATEKSEYHYGRDRRPFPWFCTLLVIILGAAITIPVIFAIILSTSKPESPTDILGRIRSELTLVKITYSPELANTSSPEFQFLVSEFEKEMGILYDSNVTKEQYAGSRVNSVSFDKKGSAKVNYDLFFDVKKMRIPTHQALKEILYSVDRDKRDRGLGVLGELRFRIESYKIVDSKVVKRVDVNDTVTGQQDISVPITKLHDVSKADSDSRNKHPVPAIIGKNRFVPNIIIKKQPNIITHKIIIKPVKPVTKDWDKLRNRDIVKDGATTAQHNTLETTIQDTSTIKSKWPKHDNSGTITSDFETHTNITEAQASTTARPSSTTIIKSTTDLAAKQLTTTVFPESSSQETIHVERNTAISVTNKTTESTTEDMSSSLKDPSSTNSDLPNLFLTTITSNKHHTTIIETAPSELKTHAALQPTNTASAAASVITHGHIIRVKDGMSATSITPILNKDEELKSTTESNTLNVQDKTSPWITTPVPKIQDTASEETISYSNDDARTLNASRLNLLMEIVNLIAPNDSKNDTELKIMLLPFMANITNVGNIAGYDRETGMLWLNPILSILNLIFDGRYKGTKDLLYPLPTSFSIDGNQTMKDTGTKMARLNLSRDVINFVMLRDGRNNTEKRDIFLPLLYYLSRKVNLTKTDRETNVVRIRLLTAVLNIISLLNDLNDTETRNIPFPLQAWSSKQDNMTESDGETYFFRIRLLKVIPIIISLLNGQNDTEKRDVFFRLLSDLSRVENLTATDIEMNIHRIRLLTIILNLVSSMNGQNDMETRDILLQLLSDLSKAGSLTEKDRKTNMLELLKIILNITSPLNGQNDTETRDIIFRAMFKVYRELSKLSNDGETNLSRLHLLMAAFKFIAQVDIQNKTQTRDILFSLLSNLPKDANLTKDRDMSMSILSRLMTVINFTKPSNGKNDTEIRTMLFSLFSNLFRSTTESRILNFQDKTFLWVTTPIPKSQDAISEEPTSYSSNHTNVSSDSTDFTKEPSTNPFHLASTTGAKNIASTEVYLKSNKSHSARKSESLTTRGPTSFPATMPTLEKQTSVVKESAGDTPSLGSTHDSLTIPAITEVFIEAIMVTPYQPSGNDVRQDTTFASVLPQERSTESGPDKESPSATKTDLHVTKQLTSNNTLSLTVNRFPATEVSTIAFETQTKIPAAQNSLATSKTISSNTKPVYDQTSSSSEQNEPLNISITKSYTQIAVMLNQQKTASQTTAIPVSKTNTVYLEPTAGKQPTEALSMSSTEHPTSSLSYVTVTDGHATEKLRQKSSTIASTSTEYTSIYDVIMTPQDSSRFFEAQPTTYEPVNVISPEHALNATGKQAHTQRAVLVAQSTGRDDSATSNQTESKTTSTSSFTPSGAFVFPESTLMALSSAYSEQATDKIKPNMTTKKTVSIQNTAFTNTGIPISVGEIDDTDFKPASSFEEITNQVQALETSTLPALITSREVPSGKQKLNEINLRTIAITSNTKAETETSTLSTKVVVPLVSRMSTEISIASTTEQTTLGSSKLENTDKQTSSFAPSTTQNISTVPFDSSSEARADVQLETTSGPFNITIKSVTESQAMPDSVAIQTPSHQAMSTISYDKMPFRKWQKSTVLSSLSLSNQEVSISTNQSQGTITMPVNPSMSNQPANILFQRTAAISEAVFDTSNGINRRSNIATDFIPVTVETKTKFTTPTTFVDIDDSGYNTTQLVSHLHTSTNTVTGNGFKTIPTTVLTTDSRFPFSKRTLFPALDETKATTTVPTFESQLSTSIESFTTQAAFHSSMKPIVSSISSSDPSRLSSSPQTTETESVTTVTEKGISTQVLPETEVNNNEPSKNVSNVFFETSTTSPTPQPNIFKPPLTSTTSAYERNLASSSDIPSVLTEAVVTETTMKTTTTPDAASVKIQRPSPTWKVPTHSSEAVEIFETSTTTVQSFKGKLLQTSTTEAIPTLPVEEPMRQTDIFQPLLSGEVSTRGIGSPGIVSDSSSESPALLPLTTISSNFVVATQISTLNETKGIDETPKDASVVSQVPTTFPMTFTNESQMISMNRSILLVDQTFAVWPFTVNFTSKARVTYESWLNFLKAILNIISSFEGQNSTHIRKTLLQSLPDLSETENYLTRNVNTNTSMLSLLMTISKIPLSFKNQSAYSFVPGLSKAKNLTNSQVETDRSALNLLKTILNFITPLYNRDYRETRRMLFRLLSDLSRIGNLKAKDRDTIVSRLNLLIAIFDMIPQFDGQTRDTLLELLSDTSRVENLTFKDGDTNVSRLNIPMAILNSITQLDDQNKTKAGDILFPLHINSFKDTNQTMNDRETEMLRLNLFMTVLNFVTETADNNMTETRDILFPLLFDLSGEENLTAKVGKTNISRIRLLTVILNLISSINDRNDTEIRHILSEFLADLPVIGNIIRKNRKLKTSMLHPLIAIINLISPDAGQNNTDTRNTLLPLLSYLSKERNLTAAEGRNIFEIRLLMTILNTISSLNGQNYTDMRDIILPLISYIYSVENQTTKGSKQNKTQTRDILFSLLANLEKGGNLTTKYRESSLSKRNPLMTIFNFITPFDDRNATLTNETLFQLLSSLSTIENLTTKERGINSSVLNLFMEILKLMTPNDSRNDTKSKIMLLPLLSNLTNVENLQGQDRETAFLWLSPILTVLSLIFDGRYEETRDVLYPLSTNFSRDRNQTMKDIGTKVPTLNLAKDVFNFVTLLDGRNSTDKRDIMAPLLSHLLRKENLTATDRETNKINTSLLTPILSVFSSLYDQNDTEARNILVPLQVRSSRQDNDNLTAGDKERNLSSIRLLKVIPKVISLSHGQNDTENRDILFRWLIDLSRAENMTETDVEINRHRIRLLTIILNLLSSINVQGNTETRDMLFQLHSDLSRAGNLTEVNGKTNMFQLLATILKILSFNGQNNKETRDTITPPMFKLYMEFLNLTKDGETDLSRLHLFMDALELIKQIDVQNQTQSRDILFSMFAKLAKDGNMKTNDRDINISRLRRLMAVMNFIAPFDGKNDTETSDMLFSLFSNLAKVGNLTTKDRDSNVSTLSRLMAVNDFITVFDGRNYTETSNMLFKLLSPFSAKGNFTTKDKEMTINRLNLLMALFNLMTRIESQNDTDAKSMIIPLMSNLTKVGNLTGYDGKTNRFWLNILMAVLKMITPFDGRLNAERGDLLLSFSTDFPSTMRDSDIKLSRINLLRNFIKFIKQLDARNNTVTRDLLLSLPSNLARTENKKAKDDETNLFRIRPLKVILNIISLLNSRNDTEPKYDLFSLPSGLSREENLSSNYVETSKHRMKLLRVILNLISLASRQNIIGTRNMLFHLLSDLPRLDVLARNEDKNASRLNLLKTLLNLIPPFDDRNLTKEKDALISLVSDLSREGNMTAKDGETIMTRLKTFTVAFRALLFRNGQNNTETFPSVFDIGRVGNLPGQEGEINLARFNQTRAILSLITLLYDRGNTETRDILFPLLSVLSKVRNYSKNNDNASKSRDNVLMAILNLFKSLYGRNITAPRAILLPLLSDSSKEGNLTKSNRNTTVSVFNPLYSITNLITPFYERNGSDATDVLLQLLSDLSKTGNLTIKDKERNALGLSLISNATLYFGGLNISGIRSLLSEKLPYLYNAENANTTDERANMHIINLLTAIFGTMSPFDGQINKQLIDILLQLRPDLSTTRNVTTADWDTNVSYIKLLRAVLETMLYFEGQSNTGTRNKPFSWFDILIAIHNAMSSFNGRKNMEQAGVVPNLTPDFFEIENMTKMDGMINRSKPDLAETIFGLIASFDDLNNSKTKNLSFPLLADFVKVENLTAVDRGKNNSRLDLLTVFHKVISLLEGQINTQTRDRFPLTNELPRVKDLTTRDGVANTSGLNLLTAILNEKLLVDRNNTKPEDLLFLLTQDSSWLENLITKDGVAKTFGFNLLKAILSELSRAENLTTIDAETNKFMFDAIKVIHRRLSSVKGENNTRAGELLLLFMPILSGEGNLTAGAGETDTFRINLLRAILRAVSSLYSKIKEENQTKKDGMRTASKFKLVSAIFNLIPSLASPETRNASTPHPSMTDKQIKTMNILLQLVSDISTGENSTTKERTVQSSRLDLLKHVVKLSVLFNSLNNTERRKILFMLMPNLSNTKHRVNNSEFANTTTIDLLTAILNFLSSFDGRIDTESRQILFQLASDLSKAENLTMENGVANFSRLNFPSAILNFFASFDGQNNTEMRNTSFPVVSDLFRAGNPTRKVEETNASKLNLNRVIFNIISPSHDHSNKETTNRLFQSLSDLSKVESVFAKNRTTNTSRISLPTVIVNLTQSVDIQNNAVPKDRLFFLGQGLSMAENPIMTFEANKSSRLNLPSTVFNVTSSFNMQNNTKSINLFLPLDLPKEKHNITSSEILKVMNNGTLTGNTTLFVRSKTAKVFNPSFEYLWSLGDSVLDTLLGSEKAFKTPDQDWDSDHLAGFNNSTVTLVAQPKTNPARFQTVNQDDIKPVEADILPDFDASVRGDGIAITVGAGFTTDFNTDIKTLRPLSISEERINFTGNTRGSSVGVPFSLETSRLISFANTVTVSSETTSRPFHSKSDLVTQQTFKGENISESQIPTLSDLQIQLSAGSRPDLSLRKDPDVANILVTAESSSLGDKLIPSVRDGTSDMRSDNLLNLGGLDGTFEILRNSDKLLKDASKANIILNNVTSKSKVNKTSTAGKIIVNSNAKRGNSNDDNFRGNRLISSDNFGFFDNVLNMNTNDIFQPAGNENQVSVNQNNTVIGLGEASENINSLQSTDRSNMISNLLSPFGSGFVNEENVPILSEFSSNFDRDITDISKNISEAKVNTSILSESLDAFDISNVLGTEEQSSNRAIGTNLTSSSKFWHPDSNNIVVPISLKDEEGKVNNKTKLLKNENATSTNTTTTVYTMINVGNYTNKTDFFKKTESQPNSTAKIELNGKSSISLDLATNMAGISTEFRENVTGNATRVIHAMEEIDTNLADRVSEPELHMNASRHSTFVTEDEMKNNSAFSGESQDFGRITSTIQVTKLEVADATMGGSRNVTRESGSSLDSTVGKFTVVPIVETSSWNSIDDAVPKNGTSKITSGERFEETSVSSGVPEIQFELSQSAYIGYPTTLHWKMFYIRGWKFIIVQKEVEGSPPLIISAITEQSRIPNEGFSSLTISQDSVFGDDSAIIYLDIPSVLCDDEGTYTVRVLESSEMVLFERSDFVQVLDVPIVQAFVPDNFFESSKAVEPYCVASLGYPAGRLFLQVQYPTNDRFETFMSTPAVENTTLEEPCRRVVKVGFGEYLNDTVNLNSTIIRCGVVDTTAILNQDGILLSNSEEINIIPDTVCGNSTSFIRHPFRPCNYIDCAKPEVVACPQNTCFNSTSNICESDNSLPVS